MPHHLGNDDVQRRRRQIDQVHPHLRPPGRQDAQRCTPARPRRAANGSGDPPCNQTSAVARSTLKATG
jgi:hypothetical protein